MFSLTNSKASVLLVTTNFLLKPSLETKNKENC